LGRGTGASTVKLYYRIGEVAGIVGVEPHVLRYWETEFPSIRPQKSRSGQRVYSRRDVDKLLRVKELLYAQRFTIAGARQRLREPASAVSVVPVPSGSEGSEGAVSSVPSTVSVSASAPSPDGRSSAAQSLRTTLLGVRGDVSRLLEALNNRNKFEHVSAPQRTLDGAVSCDSSPPASFAPLDESTASTVAEVVRSGGHAVVAEAEL
jgi:DNA-binding transcriptional MerR regulator